MKVGLLGNMNNNNFALMRYFRDLGVDAHLLLYDNDGTESVSHFTPEHDTWDIDRWNEFIHRTGISNVPASALDPPLSWLLYARGRIRRTLGIQQVAGRLTKMRDVESTLDPYDRIIGTGIAPALLASMNRSLDLFYPYSAGIEYLDAAWMSDPPRSPLKSSVNSVVRRKQAQGLRRCTNILVSDELSRQALDRRGIRYVNSAVPLVYPEKAESSRLLESLPAKVYHRIRQSKFTVLSASRHEWIADAVRGREHAALSKNNHWLISAFAELLAARPALDALLILTEYGPDVERSRELCAELGVQHAVLWLPKLPRKMLLLLASLVDVCAGEFYTLDRHIWGGTGWEALSVGKPFIQGFNFGPNEFERTFGYPPPPLLPVVERHDIVRHLLDMAAHPGKRESIANQSHEWFRRHNGTGLAEKWLELLGCGRFRDAGRSSAAEPPNV